MLLKLKVLATMALWFVAFRISILQMESDTATVFYIANLLQILDDHFYNLLLSCSHQVSVSVSAVATSSPIATSAVPSLLPFAPFTVAEAVDSRALGALLPAKHLPNSRTKESASGNPG